MIMNKHLREPSQHANGFSTLTAVVMLGAVAASVTATFLALSVTRLQISRSDEKGALATYYAESCLEEASKKLSENLTYTGGETIVFSEGTCSIEIPLGVGDTNRTLQATGYSADSIIRMQAEISQVYPSVVVTSWARVSNF